MTSVSFEFFPPVTDRGRANLVECATALAAFDPMFVSVTYGAGGTSQDRTFGVVADLIERLDVPVAGHLTVVNARKDDTQRTIDRYAELGVSHIVALRGDPPADSPSDAPTGYETAADLVTAIRSRPDGAGFEISVSAYPEVHPKAASAKADLDNLKRKIDAGADRAISQFFFDPEVFLTFRDAVSAAGIDAPLVPGIMPVTNFAAIRRFAAACGATIPSWMSTMLGGLDDDPEVSLAVAATIVVEQCKRLEAEGVEDFHIYTMNRRPLAAATCRSLGVGSSGQTDPITPSPGLPR